MISVQILKAFKGGRQYFLLLVFEFHFFCLNVCQWPFLLCGAIVVCTGRIMNFCPPEGLVSTPQIFLKKDCKEHPG